MALAVIGAGACKSSDAGSASGTGGSPGQGSDAGTDAPASSGSGGARGTGGGPGQSQPDCFPDCVARARQNCEKPLVDAGSCISGPSTSAGVTTCFSNGVHQIQMQPAPDGGLALFVITNSDGTTVCYQVVIDSNNVQHYQMPDGTELAAAVPLPADAGASPSASLVRVTCAGSSSSTTIDLADPTCARLSNANCQAGACP